MRKPIPTKKSAKFQRKPIARGKRKRVSKEPTVIIGIDVSMSSIAMAGLSLDTILNEIRGPEFVIRRWESGTHYFDRITDCAHPENYIWNLLSDLKCGNVELENFHIAVEEPWPLGIVGRAQSSYLKQQAEISGALLAGLLRYGYKNIFQIPANYWRKLVADELGITMHHSKWKAQDLGWATPDPCGFFNCKPGDLGKFRAKQWALGTYGREVPDWPEIIESSKGKIPRPDDSRAKAIQCDDRYDALAICEWMHREWKAGLDK
jgi:hypothetical protein